MTMSRKRAESILLRAAQNPGRCGDDDNVPSAADVEKAKNVLGYGLSALRPGSVADVQFGLFTATDDAPTS